MFRTLFLLPHEALGLPLLGVGWGAAILAIYVIARIIWGARRDGKVTQVIAAEGLTWILAAVFIVVIGPRLELLGADGEPVGLAIRGYGLFLMLAAGSAVALAAYRCDRYGMTSEPILRIAPYALIGGIVGARLFFVIQYREDFIRESVWETIKAAAALTEGGLVVYGSFIGGFLAAVYASRRMHFPIWRMGDVIVPCLFVGLMFGRMGCLMNGCCYGGACEPGPLALQFPPGSPVYYDQMLGGRLIGVQADIPDGHAEDGQRADLDVQAVEPGSLADEAGIEAGDQVTLALDPSTQVAAPPGRPAEERRLGLVAMEISGNQSPSTDAVTNPVIRFTPDDLPDRAAPVVGTQLISSVLAAIATALLLVLDRWRHSTGGRTRFIARDGMLMLTGFITYAVIRIVLEWVRVDEAGQFGTLLSISQWVSLFVIAASLVAMTWVPPTVTLPPEKVAG